VEDFRPHPTQRRFFEGGAREFLTGQRSGRRRGIEMAIVTTAATAEDARLLLEDLNRDGIALQTSDGRRVEPPHRNGARFTYMRFDEEEKT
jgi:hypothetical protein